MGFDTNHDELFGLRMKLHSLEFKDLKWMNKPR